MQVVKIKRSDGDVSKTITRMSEWVALIETHGGDNVEIVEDGTLEQDVPVVTADAEPPPVESQQQPTEEAPDGEEQAG